MISFDPKNDEKLSGSSLLLLNPLWILLVIINEYKFSNGSYYPIIYFGSFIIIFHNIRFFWSVYNRSQTNQGKILSVIVIVIFLIIGFITFTILNDKFDLI